MLNSSSICASGQSLKPNPGRRRKGRCAPRPSIRWCRLGHTVLLWAALVLGPPWLWAQEAAGDAAGHPQLRLIEALYQDGDGYRAESEILRFLHDQPGHPLRPRAELARAKLYYREGRYKDARLMLLSLLDRHPSHGAAGPARRLLAFSQVRLGRHDAAAAMLREAQAGDGAPLPPDALPGLAALAAPHPDAVDPDAAAAWSTWLPGSGYFALGRPGKAVTAITLNLALLGATAHFAAQDSPGPALLFLFLEALLWQGGRSGVRQEALAHNQALRLARTRAWLERQGEAALLRIGIQTRFGGP